MKSPLGVEHLRAAFRDVELDGREAQRTMEPRRRGPRPVGAEGGSPRAGAALAYLFERDGRLLLPLTVRSASMREHRGQVSLPGGRPHDGESLEDAAWREAREEIGLEVGPAETLGWLAPVDIPVSHSRLHVVVAIGEVPGALRPDPREVQRIELVGLDELVRPETRRMRTIQIGAEDVTVPFFDVEGLFLWGATSMALSELVERLRAVRP